MTAEERDHILLHGSLEEQRQMFIRATGFEPSCDEVVLRSVNKAITALTYLPKDRRKAAKQWLMGHGSESWDNGDL